MYDIVALGLRTRKMDKELIDKKVKDILEVCGLSDLANRFPRQMSGGQRQRVALARSLVIEPKLLLLDEPLSNLDAKQCLSMRVEIKRLQKKLGLITLYVTHDQVEAMSMADDIVLMKDGYIVQQSSPRELYNNPNCVYAAQFIGTPQMNIVKDILPEGMHDEFRPKKVY